ncbi:MAG: hypothetical protein IJJ33_04435 [Victivallales bacterium]|nr:hypothetical protein [Victivallales bacterium]
MRQFLCIAILSMFLQGCIITAPCTVAWRSNTTQLVADTEGHNERGADTNSVNADKQTDISATVPTSKNSTKSVAEKCVEKAAKKASDDDDCPECRN